MDMARSVAALELMMKIVDGYFQGCEQRKEIEPETNQPSTSGPHGVAACGGRSFRFRTQDSIRRAEVRRGSSDVTRSTDSG